MEPSAPGIQKAETIASSLRASSVYEPIIAVVTEALGGPHGEAVSWCVNDYLGWLASAGLNVSDDELETTFSYLPVIAPIAFAFKDSVQFPNLLRAALRFTISVHDVPANHLLNVVSDDSFMFDGIRGAAIAACVKDEYPTEDEMVWLGEHYETLLPFAAVITSRADLSREFCEALLSEHRTGAPSLRQGIL